jgi:extradiol dioxygenase family protein
MIDTDQPPRFHLSLAVRPERLQPMTAFYATLFGVPPRKSHADHVQFDLAEPPLNLSFVPRASSAGGELDHLGIQVFSAEALQRARTRLAAAGLALREEPAVECCYARQDKFWLTDPEGRQVEVFLRLDDIEHHGRAGPATAAAAACCDPGCCVPA